MDNHSSVGHKEPPAVRPGDDETFQRYEASPGFVEGA